MLLHHSKGAKFRNLSVQSGLSQQHSSAFRSNKCRRWSCLPLRFFLKAVVFDQNSSSPQLCSTVCSELGCSVAIAVNSQL